MRQFRQGGGLQELAQMIAIERRNAAPPTMVAGLARGDWREIQDLGMNRYYSTTVIVPDEHASDGAAVRLDGANKAWVVQVKLHSLPQDGQWNLYAAVRADTAGAAADADALHLGSAPPMGRFTKVTAGELADGDYHFIKVPGGPFRYNPDEGAVTYLHGGGGAGVKYIYVDRFVAVRSDARQ